MLGMDGDVLAAPHHVYALGDMRKVKEFTEHHDGRNEGCFVFQFNNKWPLAESATPAQVVCVTDTRKLMHRWISGMQARLHRQQEPGVPRARTVWVDTIDPRSHGKSTDSGRKAPSEADSSDGEEEDDSSERGKSGSDHAPYGTDGQRPKAKGIGVRCRNLPSSPIGAELEDVESHSPASIAGLQVGDIIVAVNGQAVRDA